MPELTEKQQLEQAVRYCRDHKPKRCGAKKCLKDNPQRWPLVTVGKLDPLIQGRRTFQIQEHKDAILTRQERLDLAETLRKAADAGCPARKCDRDGMVVDVLRWRDEQNAAGGRGFAKLSEGARNVLQRGAPKWKFWRRFFKEFPDITPHHNVVSTSMQRAKQCTKAVAADHHEKLREVATALGIYDADHDHFVPGKQGNIIWLDEFNQFFNYNLARGNNLRRTGRTGVRARQASTENRGTFSGAAACGYDMHLYDPQVIFAVESLSTSQIPDCIEKLPHMLLESSDGTDEDNSYAGYKVGDSVRVYWSMEEPPAWFQGTVVKVGGRGLKVEYKGTSDWCWHDPAKWDVQQGNAPPPDAKSSSDSEDDCAFGELFKKN